MLLHARTHQPVTRPESEAWYAEQLLKSAAEHMPDMDAEFPALLLQTILEIGGSANELKAEIGECALVHARAHVVCDQR